VIYQISPKISQENPIEKPRRNYFGNWGEWNPDPENTPWMEI